MIDDLLLRHYNFFLLLVLLGFFNQHLLRLHQLELKILYLLLKLLHYDGTFIRLLGNRFYGPVQLGDLFLYFALV